MKRIITAILLLIVFTMIGIFWWFYPEFLYWKVKLPKGEILNTGTLGQHGDLYGSLNAMFSGLAMCGAFIAIYFGSIDRTARQIEEHLFKHLETVNKITDGLKLFKGKISYKINGIKYSLEIPSDVSGRTVFLILRDNFKVESISNHPKGNIGKYEDFYEEYLHRLLGHYFRSIYHAVKYIDKSKLSKKQKIFYIHMLRAQISSDELFFCFTAGYQNGGKINLLHS